VSLQWRKSSRSQPSGGECVELAVNALGAIRDSKHPDAPYLTVAPRALAALLAAIKTGDYDR